MPPKMRRLQVRLEPGLEAKIAALARRWGPVKPLTPSNVVRRCVARVYRSEAPPHSRQRARGQNPGTSTP